MPDRPVDDEDPVSNRLREAVDAQRSYLTAYEKPSAAITFETLRALDDLFLRDLMMPDQPLSPDERRERRLSTWGASQALRRVLPRIPDTYPFLDFPSYDATQEKADEFLFNCAVLELSERYQGLLREGVLTGTLNRHPGPDESDPYDVLVLRSAIPSYSDEEIGRAGLRWASDLVVMRDRDKEQRLERRHRRFTQELRRRVDLVDGWRIIYDSTPEIDAYFLEWGRLYLKRIFSQDMLGPEDAIGGRAFSRYVEVLSVLSGRSQKHLAFAAILLARDPSTDIRDLLTAFADREGLIRSVAECLDADRAEVEAILMSLTLSGENLDAHTRSGDPIWPPLVRACSDSVFLPIYGLDLNPFLFLLTDLRYRYEKDWFTAANNRERRWIVEIEELFRGPRWQTHGRNLHLQEAGKDLTDIDFAIFDRKTNQLALLQLKWQHPIGVDNRSRRSAGKNLIEKGNYWVEAVRSWLDRHGADELCRRLKFEQTASAQIHLFVLGRYHVHLTGFDALDERAVWADWAHFRRVRLEGPKFSIAKTELELRTAVAHSRARKTGESYMFPLGDISVVLNPTAVPEEEGAVEGEEE